MVHKRWFWYFEQLCDASGNNWISDAVNMSSVLSAQTLQFAFHDSIWLPWISFNSNTLKHLPSCTSTLGCFFWYNCCTLRICCANSLPFPGATTNSSITCFHFCLQKITVWIKMYFDSIVWVLLLQLMVIYTIYQDKHNKFGRFHLQPLNAHDLVMLGIYHNMALIT